MIAPSSAGCWPAGAPRVIAMRISVVAPTYNRQESLRQTLAALLDQSYADYEIIVADDGSTDGAAERLACLPGVRWLRLNHGGPAAARNAGILAAAGEIIAFTDDDCRPPADWLARLADGYARYPQVAGVGGYLRAPAEVERRSVLARYDWLLNRQYGVGEEEVLAGFDCPAGGTGNMSYRRAVLEEVGGFDESFPMAAGEDADLKWRICQAGHQLLYAPVGVDHLRAYTWRSFLRQQVQRGRGAARFEEKHAGRRPGAGRILLRLGKRTWAVWPHLWRYEEKKLALVEMLAGWLDCWGQARPA